MDIAQCSKSIATLIAILPTEDFQKEIADIDQIRTSVRHLDDPNIDKDKYHLKYYVVLSSLYN